MRRVLLISLALVLAVVGWSTVGAEDSFYVIGGGKISAPVVNAPVPMTGQTTSYGTRDDGDLKMGAAWPTPRFTDNQNGTVTDNLTQLIWMKNAGALGTKTWDQALADANGLKSGDAGLTDGSQAGEWRLPNLRELQSLFDYGRHSPALPKDHPFMGVQTSWSSTTSAFLTHTAWAVYSDDGFIGLNAKSSTISVWCVRGGP